MNSVMSAVNYRNIYRCVEKKYSITYHRPPVNIIPKQSNMMA